MPWEKDSLVVNWKGQLGIVNLGSAQPLKGMTMLKHINNDTFARLRKDNTEAERVFFERAKNGDVTKLNWHEFTYLKNLNDSK